MIQVRLAKSCDRTMEHYDKRVVFRYTTDSFHLSEVKSRTADLTYKIQGNCIFTSPLEEGTIEIAYMRPQVFCPREACSWAESDRRASLESMFQTPPQ